MIPRFTALAALLCASLAFAADNQLTDQEKAEGWVLLFDGKSLDGWAGDKPLKAENVKDGTINTFKIGSYVAYFGQKKFGDFVLSMDFKVSKGCNSGVFIRTANMKDPVQTGFEIQVMDSHGKENLGKHEMGALYDAQSPIKNASKPAGEWQNIQITAKGDQISVVLNGEKVLDADLSKWTEKEKNPDGSKNKFKTALKDFAKEGYIGMQDHGHDCWYKNIKIKELK